MFTRPGNANYVPPPPPVSGQQSGVDPDIHSVADLLNIATKDIVCPLIKVWVNYGDGTSQTWILLALAGGQEPGDYDPANPKTWFKSST